MKKIFLFLFAIVNLIFFQNCSASKAQNHHYQREWMLISFDNFTKHELIEMKAGINLTGEKTGIVVGAIAVMGCNKIFFDAEIKNKNRIKISNLGNTEMACQNMKLEKAFLEKIKNMNRYNLDGHRLTLSDNKGNEMKFIAADWD